jgi:hypothetical protein
MSTGPQHFDIDLGDVGVQAQHCLRCALLARRALARQQQQKNKPRGLTAGALEELRRPAHPEENKQARTAESETLDRGEIRGDRSDQSRQKFLNRSGARAVYLTVL